MMKFLFSLTRCFILMFCFCLLATAQAGESTAQHFQSNSLSFNYPSDWKLIDQSDDRLQRFTLTQNYTATIISIAFDRYPISTNERRVADGYDLLLNEILKKFGADSKAESYPQTLEVSYLEVDGARLHGIYNNVPATGELWVGSLEKRPVVVARFRVDKERAKSNSTWGMILSSLKLNPPLVRRITGACLGIKAVSLPAPRFPEELAYRIRTNGFVNVLVTADEKGNVVSAHAISGNQLFRLEAVAAAYRAKFIVEKLYGKPIRFRYVINYYFYNRD